MPSEVLLKKLEQISSLLGELEKLLSVQFEEFYNNITSVRAAERIFQLAVDLAIDINTQIILEHKKGAPDTYRQSFIELGRIGMLPQDLARQISASAGLRNILVHEYDFEEDYKKFYDSAREFVPLYREYIKALRTIYST